jgi:hypothetical protein
MGQKDVFWLASVLFLPRLTWSGGLAAGAGGANRLVGK